MKSAAEIRANVTEYFKTPEMSAMHQDLVDLKLTVSRLEETVKSLCVQQELQTKMLDSLVVLMEGADAITAE